LSRERPNHFNPCCPILSVIAAIANIYSHAFRGASIHFAKTCTSLLATRSGTSCAGLEEFVTSCPLCASNLQGGIFCRDGDSFFRPLKLGQARRLVIPKHFGLLGLRVCAVYSTENRIGVAPNRYADKRILYIE
jgi:hypothetical protein